MGKFRIIKLSNMWSTEKLIRATEEQLNQLCEDGYEIVGVSFGVNLWWIPTAYITVRKK